MAGPGASGSGARPVAGVSAVTRTDSTDPTDEGEVTLAWSTTDHVDGIAPAFTLPPALDAPQPPIGVQTGHTLSTTELSRAAESALIPCFRKSPLSEGRGHE